MNIINQVFRGDSCEILSDIEDNSVDMIITSPPYDKLRNYGNTLNSWNEEKFKCIATHLSRVLKEGGIIVWNVNDAVENGSRTCTSFRQVLFFVEECGLKLNDTMIWCLSGGTYLYVKSSKGVQPMTIKDMVRLDPSTIQLWDGMKWVNIVKWYENKDAKTKIRIQLRSGENIYCTNEHRWVLENGEEVLTKDLKIGDILKTCNLPNEGVHLSINKIDIVPL